MQISEYTKKVLESFVNINSGIVIYPTDAGESSTRLRTRDRQLSIQGEAVVNEVFDKTVAIYDLRPFLAVLNNFPDAEVTLYDNYLTVTSDNVETKLVFTETNFVEHPDKSPNIPDSAFEFDLPEKTLKQVLNNGNILSLPQFNIVTKNGEIKLRAVDPRNPNSNVFEVSLGSVNTDEEHSFYIKQENLRSFMPGDYRVKVIGDQAAKFESQDHDGLFYLTTFEII